MIVFITKDKYVKNEYFRPFENFKNSYKNFWNDLLSTYVLFLLIQNRIFGQKFLERPPTNLCSPNTKLNFRPKISFNQKFLERPPINLCSPNTKSNFRPKISFNQKFLDQSLIDLSFPNVKRKCIQNLKHYINIFIKYKNTKIYIIYFLLYFFFYNT